MRVMHHHVEGMRGQIGEAVCAQLLERVRQDLTLPGGAAREGIGLELLAAFPGLDDRRYNEPDRRVRDGAPGSVGRGLDTGASGEARIIQEPPGEKARLPDDLPRALRMWRFLMANCDRGVSQVV